MKNLNYHHLLYFKAIAENGSIARASEQLLVGQSSLSLQLKALEETLEHKLFERKGRSLEITEAGKIVLEYGQKIESLGKELLGVLENKSFSTQPTLKIGALDSIPKSLICDLADLSHKETGCYFSIYEDELPSLLHSLVNHQLDCLISDTEVRHLKGENIYSQKLFHENIVVFASKKYQKHKRGFPHSLEGVPCIVPTSHSRLRDTIENYFMNRNISPNYIAETQDTSVQKLLAVKGDGVIFLPQFAAKELLSKKSLIQLGTLEEVFSDFYLVYNKKMFDNPALEVLLRK